MVKMKMAYGATRGFILVGIILLCSLHLVVGSEVSPLSRNIDPEIQRRIDDYIENDFLPASQVTGLGLAIVQNDGEILYTTGYGPSDIAREIPNTNSSQFLIASVTKSMTALLAATQLHEKFPQLGEAALDTPIRNLIPQANFTLNDRFRSEHTTFRDLLAHRMCLAKVDIDLAADPFTSSAESVYRARYASEMCGMRGEFQYSNRMYNVAGEMAALLAGKSYIDAMQDLFDQIGMTNSAFAMESDDYSQLPFRAKPYYIRENDTRPFNTSLLFRGRSPASGELFVPMNDFATYIRLQLNKGNIAGKQIIPREVIEWLTRPSMVTSQFDQNQSGEKLIWQRFGYGLGFQLGSYDGWSCIMHGGYVPPYMSLFTMFPGKKLGIFTSSNMGPVKVDQKILHTFIFELLTGNKSNVDVDPKEKAMKVLDQLNAKKEAKKRKIEQEIVKNATVANVILDNMVGKYGSGSLGDAEVTERFNEQRNKTEYYLEYGLWYHGWLLEVDGSGGSTFNFVYDTDAIHDDYADGGNGDDKFIKFDNNGTMTLFAKAGGEEFIFATFKLGESLDTLPPIPWDSGSC